MGLRDVLRAVNSARHPEHVVLVESIGRGHFGRARIHVRVFTGVESPWQAPLPTYVDTDIPAGTVVAPGMFLAAQYINGSGTNAWRILWDRPAQPPPPMNFPTIPNGDDPRVMLEHLRGLVAAGALTQEGFDGAEAYLRATRPVR